MMFPMGFSAADGQVRFAPIPGEPGYAHFLAPDMPQLGSRLPIDEAETHRINHDRETCLLEKMGDMPRVRDLGRKQCRRYECHKTARFRCSACWTWYCSKACQRRNWRSHVFTCTTPSRPNDADYLRLIMARVKVDMVSEDLARIHDAFLELFADDHICRTFGFSKTVSRSETALLVCLYDTIITTCRKSVHIIQKALEAGRLGDMLLQYCQHLIDKAGGQSECDCITWYLDQGADQLFLEPAVDGDPYSIRVTGFTKALELLHVPLPTGGSEGPKFNLAQLDVLYLFAVIHPSVWQLPGIYSSAWINFGFCYCKSYSQRKELANRYLDLACSAATFDEIVSAYKTHTMADLMRSHGINTSSLEGQGIMPRTPSACQFAVYRLMTGVEHALSGRYCECFKMREGRRCHQYFETHLDSEADTGYGFHLSSSWERWQLLNFYKHVFGLPGFDPQTMASAKESGEKGGLEKYLDTLVPDTRGKLFDRRRAENLTFPRLGGRLEGYTVAGERIPHFHSHCQCKRHDVVGPPGIRHRPLNHAVECLDFSCHFS